MAGTEFSGTDATLLDPGGREGGRCWPVLLWVSAALGIGSLVWHLHVAVTSVLQGSVDPWQPPPLTGRFCTPYSRGHPLIWAHPPPVPGSGSPRTPPPAPLGKMIWAV